MAKFAPVAPLSIMKQLYEKGLAGDYHLLIATEVQKDVQGWKDLIHEERPAICILDNGVIESGQSLKPKELQNLALEARCTHVVLPDVLGDGEGTRDAVMQALSFDWKLPVIAVVQGNCPEDVMRCIGLYASILPRGSWISIPRIVANDMGTRIPFARAAHAFGRPVHLLGFSDDIIDDMRCCNVLGVRGIDSALPLWLPSAERGNRYLDMWMGSPALAELKRPQDYWHWLALSEYQLGVAKSNLAYIRRWVEFPTLLLNEP